MPHVIVKLAAGRTERQKAKIAEDIARAVMASAQVAEQAVSVGIEDVEPADWAERVYRPDIAGRWDRIYKKPGYDPSNAVAHLMRVGCLALALSLGRGVAAEEVRVTVVRIAELDIDPARLEAYEAAVREEIETSVRTEPGVLAIYAVAEKADPSKLRFFEIYADEAAYDAHIASAHFRKYAETTKDMILSKRLVETVPVQLGAKPR